MVLIGKILERDIVLALDARSGNAFVVDVQVLGVYNMKCDHRVTYYVNYIFYDTKVAAYNIHRFIGAENQKDT